MNNLIDFASNHIAELTVVVMLALAFAGFYWLCWRTFKGDLHEKYSGRRRASNRSDWKAEHSNNNNL